MNPSPIYDLDVPRETVTVATYYNFKIFSDRILFIVDVSGSMEWPESKAGDPNRIAVAKRELVKAIRSLDEKTLFNLATFAGHVNTWQKDGEVPATHADKAAALAWIEGALLPRGATNTYGALTEGLDRNPKGTRSSSSPTAPPRTGPKTRSSTRSGRATSSGRSRSTWSRSSTSPSGSCASSRSRTAAPTSSSRWRTRSNKI